MLGLMVRKPRKTYLVGNPRKRLRLRQSYTPAGKRIHLFGPVGFATAYFRNWKRGTGKAFKHIDDGAAVTGGVADKLGYGRVAYLAHLNVDESCRSKGYGAKIIELVENLDKNVDLLMLIANAESDELEPRLHAFYRKCGFHAWKDKPFVFYKRLRPNPNRKSGPAGHFSAMNVRRHDFRRRIRVAS